MLHPGLTPLPGVPFQKNHVSPSPFLGVCFPAPQAKTPSLRIWDGWGSALFLLPNFKLLQRGTNSQFTEDSCFPYKQKETPVGTSSPSAFQEHVVRVCLGRSDHTVSKTARAPLLSVPRQTSLPRLPRSQESQKESRVLLPRLCSNYSAARV